MRVARLKIELALDKNCMALSDSRNTFSSTTLTRMMKKEFTEVRPQTVGRLDSSLN